MFKDGLHTHSLADSMSQYTIDECFNFSRYEWFIYYWGSSSDVGTFLSLCLPYNVYQYYPYMVHNHAVIHTGEFQGTRCQVLSHVADWVTSLVPCSLGFHRMLFVYCSDWFQQTIRNHTLLYCPACPTIGSLVSSLYVWYSSYVGNLSPNMSKRSTQMPHSQVIAYVSSSSWINYHFLEISWYYTC